MPETTAGVPAPRVLVLYHPEIPEPTFSTPEPQRAGGLIRLLTRRAPGSSPTCPRVMNPDPPPLVLKNPYQMGPCGVAEPRHRRHINDRTPTDGAVEGRRHEGETASGNSVNASISTDSPVTRRPAKGQNTR